MSQISGQAANGRRASSKGAPKTGKDKGRRRDLLRRVALSVGWGGNPLKCCSFCVHLVYDDG